MAGVDKLIHFQSRGVEDLHHPKKYGFIITNPPYGERLQDKSQMPALLPYHRGTFSGTGLLEHVSDHCLRAGRERYRTESRQEQEDI